MRATRALRVLGAFLVVVLLYFVVPVSMDAKGGVVLRTLATALLMAALATLIVLQIQHLLIRPSAAIDGLVTAIALVWVVVALTVYVVDLNRPGEFAGLSTRIDALYFTASTMLTVGYGDIHAAGQLARGITVVQMVFNVAFVATAGAVLSSRVRSRAEERAAERGAEHGAGRGAGRGAEYGAGHGDGRAAVPPSDRPAGRPDRDPQA